MKLYVQRVCLNATAIQTARASPPICFEDCEILIHKTNNANFFRGLLMGASQTIELRGRRR